MPSSEGTFILFMIAYFLPVALTAILIVSDMHSSVASVTQNTGFNRGLKVLELVMNVSSIPSHHESRKS